MTQNSVSCVCGGHGTISTATENKPCPKCGPWSRTKTVTLDGLHFECTDCGGPSLWLGRCTRCWSVMLRNEVQLREDRRAA